MSRTSTTIRLAKALTAQLNARPLTYAGHLDAFAISGANDLEPLLAEGGKPRLDVVHGALR